MAHLLAPLLRRTVPRAVAVSLVTWGAVLPVAPQVGYSITDGVADLTLSIDPSEAIVFLNTFPVAPGGAYIDQVLVAYGRAGGPSALNGKPVRILLYEDTNGGSPQDAALLWSFNTTIANGNTDVLNVYSVPRMRVVNTLVVGFYYRNTTFAPVYVGALDTTEPTLLERSWFGFGAPFDPAHLDTIPAAQSGFQESSGNPGNFRIEARGQPTDGIALSVEKQTDLGLVRLSWTGTRSSYVLERASRPDFADAQTLASGTLASYDDPALADGTTWYYRVR
jgi:hypothetical protein